MPKKKKEKKLDDEILENGASAEGTADGDDQPVDDDEIIEVEEALDDDTISLDEKLGLVKVAWEASEAKAAEYLDGGQRAKAEFAKLKMMFPKGFGETGSNIQAVSAAEEPGISPVNACSVTDPPVSRPARWEPLSNGKTASL